MALEKSVGAIVVNQRNRYLLLRRTDKISAFWEFSKGHKKIGETDKQTLKRELDEECGIKKFEIRKVVGENSYINSKGNRRVILLYLVFVPSIKIQLSEEHAEYRWVTFEQGMRKLNHDTWKRLLTKANKMVVKNANAIKHFKKQK